MKFPATSRAAAFSLVLASTGACTKEAPHPEPEPAAAPAPGSASLEPEADEHAHRVVFSDRTSHGYLLLFDGPIRPKVPSREQLVDVVEHSFPGNEGTDEVRLLIDLIRTEPHSTNKAPSNPEDPGSLEQVIDPKQDLLGLHIEVLEVDDDLIPSVALTDDILVRALTPTERRSLPGRRWALLLRADYRNMHAVRGLRLLQTLVRIVAEREGALVHDPDTLETTGAAIFSERRLHGSLGNIADQLTVVPFPDPRHEGRVRLTTRGMRRFGSVDLELDGLEPDPWVLQRGTDLLLGLALVMIKDGEFDPSGFAIQLGDSVTIHWRDAERAYAGREGTLPRCADCPEDLVVHLVVRERLPQDPQSHVVARVVAPRQTSDSPDYDHVAWTADALTRVFGNPAGE